ncbi:MAG: hypothetical protein KID04_06790 [Clostridium sp.]|nr:hypothetical protein [Clostridium sp.]
MIGKSFGFLRFFGNGAQTVEQLMLAYNKRTHAVLHHQICHCTGGRGLGDVQFRGKPRSKSIQSMAAVPYSRPRAVFSAQGLVFHTVDYVDSVRAEVLYLRRG